MFNEGTFKRHRNLNIFVLLVLLAFAARLTWFQVIAADTFRAEAKSAISVTKNIEAVRGNIVDSQGNILATTIFTWDVNIDPVNVGPVTLDIDGKKTAFSKEEIDTYLGTILNVKPKSILAKMTGVGRYANLKKSATATQFTQLKNLDIPWLYFDRKQTRYYPQGAVAGNLIGFVGTDGSALAGIERTMNSCLAGNDGKESYEQGADLIKIPSSIRTMVLY